MASSINNNEKVPEFLFDIQNIIVQKIPNDREKFTFVLKYVESLKNSS